MGNISVVKLVSNLEVLMDFTLSWEPQISSIINKSKSVLYRFKRMSAFTDTDTRRKLTSHLVFSALDYYAAIYDDPPGQLDTKLQILLSSCVRHVFGLGWHEHVTPFCQELNWLLARNCRFYLSSRLLHKILLTSSPSHLFDLFNFHVLLYASRREGSQIKIQFSTSQQLLDSFSVHTANFWNSLPSALRTKRSRLSKTN